MTIQFFDCRSAIQRCGRPLVKFAQAFGRSLRAGFADSSGPHKSLDSMNARYFGLLVHVNGSGRRAGGH
jgi:hypothetical protein